MNYLDVANVSMKPGRKRLSLKSASGKKSFLLVHHFAPVGQGNEISVDPNHTKRIYVKNKENLEDPIKITPHFEQFSQLRIGNQKFNLKMAELITSEDFQDFKYLEQFHYKSSSAVNMGVEEEHRSKNQHGSGRRVVILCRIKRGSFWEPLGYVELCMPLQMMKPRHILLDRPFEHPERPIAWDEWKINEIKKYVNLIVRIGRIVTSPEFRGLGTAKLLIRAAKEYSRTRWQIAGKRPLFMEISAEMLKYLDFVSSSGFHFAGNTEGNIDRVYKDLTAMMRGQKITSGIMTLQKKYLTTLERASERLGCTIDDLMTELKEITHNPEIMNTFEPAKYYSFKSVLRFPIPYYICGLDPYTEKYVREGIIKKNKRESISLSVADNTRIRLQNLTAHCKYKINHTPAVKSIMDSFGLEGDQLTYDILGPIDLEASSGNIIFIAGVSGSGKSVLLKAIDYGKWPDTLKIECENQSKPPCYQVSWMEGIPSEEPIIEYLSSKFGIEPALSALNRAGLAEAFVYLKPYSLLSRGQKYRVRLAYLSLTQSPVLLVDEFCADLDPLTAKIVAHNFRKYVLRTKKVAFVAAANNSHFIDALRPVRVINLLHGGRSVMMSYREYVNELNEEH